METFKFSRREREKMADRLTDKFIARVEQKRNYIKQEFKSKLKKEYSGNDTLTVSYEFSLDALALFVLSDE